MTIGDDRVQVTKVESTAKGGDDADKDVYGAPRPLDPTEDALESAGWYLQEPGSPADETVYVYRDSGVLYGCDQFNTSPVAFLQAVAGTLLPCAPKVISQNFTVTAGQDCFVGRRLKVADGFRLKVEDGATLYMR